MSPNPIAPETLARLVELAAAALIVRDCDGTILFWNRRAEEVYGWKAAEVLGQASHRLWSSESPISHEAINQELHAKGLWMGEQRHMRKDGTWITVLSRQTLHDEGRGGAPLVLEVNLNITAQKEAEAQRDAASIELRRLNASLERRVAARTAELEAALAERDREIAARRRTEDELRAAYARLSERTEETELQAEELRAQNDQLLQVTRMLSEREENLRQARAELEQRVQDRTADLLAANRSLAQQAATLHEQAELLNMAHEAVFVRDLNGVVRFWNHGASEMYGWSCEEAVGQSIYDLLHTIYPETLDEIVARLLQLDRWEGELVHTRRDGSQITVESRWTVQYDESGQPVAILEINSDITERKRAEAANAALLAKLQTSRQQLQTLSHRLADSLENERRTIARELHDVSGQALTAVLINLGMLQQREDCPPGVRQALAELKEQTNLVMRDLHDLSWNLRPASLDRLGLASAIEQLLESFQKQYAIKVDLAMAGMSDDSRLPADVETMLYRIAQEALTNVARHAQASQTSVLIQRDDDRVLMYVEDDGQGFDVAEATKGERLGLLGMQERAETLGGVVEVESTPGVGTTVIVRVPLSASGPAI